MSGDVFADLFPRAYTPETAAHAEAQGRKAHTRWQAMDDDQRRSATSAALQGRKRADARRKAVQAAADDLSATTFTIAMEAVAGLKAEDGRTRLAALDSASARFIVAVHDLSAALAAIDAQDGAQ